MHVDDAHFPARLKVDYIEIDTLNLYKPLELMSNYDSFIWKVSEIGWNFGISFHEGLKMMLKCWLRPSFLVEYGHNENFQNWQLLLQATKGQLIFFIMGCCCRFGSWFFHEILILSLNLGDHLLLTLAA